MNPRNWLWDEQRGRLILVDFEHAEVRRGPPPGSLSRKRKRNILRKLKSDDCENRVREPRGDGPCLRLAVLLDRTITAVLFPSSRRRFLFVAVKGHAMTLQSTDWHVSAVC